MYILSTYLFPCVCIYTYIYTRFPWGAELYLWCAGHGFCCSQHLGLLSLGKMSATQRPDDHREPFESVISRIPGPTGPCKHTTSNPRVPGPVFYHVAFNSLGIPSHEWRRPDKSRSRRCPALAHFSYLVLTRIRIAAPILSPMIPL